MTNPATVRQRSLSRTAVIAESEGCALTGGAVHTHTRMSDGDLDPSTLVSFAHRKGLGVLCITDHHFNSWRYARLLKIHKASVCRFGIAEYFDAIRKAARTSEGPIVLPGIELVPQYWWRGVPPFLTCHVMKPLVLYGIDDPRMIEDLPVRLEGHGNERYALATAQAVLDRVRGLAGLAFWSHLEEDERIRFYTAEMLGRRRPDLLETTSGYAGFGVFPAGFEENCAPGGRWDRALAGRLETGCCDGPWVIGEADYHGGDGDEKFRNLCNPATMFWLQALTAADVLAALAGGRMYAYQGPHFSTSFLETYHVRAPGGALAKSGSVLRTGGQPTLELSVRGFSPCCTIRAICGGSVIAEAETHTLTLPLAAPQAAGYFCRAEVLGGCGEHIVTNPIYVLPEED